MFSCVLLIFVLFTPIFACTLNGTTSIFQRWGEAENIFVGKIISLKKKLGLPFAKKTILGANIRVSKVYRGTLKDGDILFFSQGNGAECRYVYEDGDVGNILLMSAHRHPDRIGEWVKGAMADIETAYEDLLFVENLDKYRGMTRISGTLYTTDRPSEYLYSRPETTLPRQRVLLIGMSGQYELTTDDHGVYEKYGLPPGLYFVVPFVSPNLSFNKTIYADLQGLENDTEEIGKQYLAIKEKYPRVVTPDWQYVFVPPVKQAEISFVYTVKK